MAPLWKALFVVGLCSTAIFASDATCSEADGSQCAADTSGDSNSHMQLNQKIALSKKSEAKSAAHLAQRPMTESPLASSIFLQALASRRANLKLKDIYPDNCTDQDEAVVEEAASKGEEISGCADLVEQCGAEEIAGLCPKSCNLCAFMFEKNIKQQKAAMKPMPKKSASVVTSKTGHSLTSANCEGASEIPNQGTRLIPTGYSGLCDSGLYGWYYYPGHKMPESRVAEYSCGTHAPGYLTSPHPAESGSQSTIQVCFAWSGSGCMWSRNVDVINCGDKFVYNFQGTPTCSLSYCFEEGQPATTTTTPPPELAPEGMSGEGLIPSVAALRDDTNRDLNNVIVSMNETVESVQSILAEVSR